MTSLSTIALIGPRGHRAYFASTVAPLRPQRRFRRASIAQPFTYHCMHWWIRWLWQRQVQILHGMLNMSSVYLLNDAAPILMLRAADGVHCPGRVLWCLLRAPHILDGTKGWATHVALMSEGHVSFLPIDQIEESLGSMHTSLWLGRKASRFNVPRHSPS